MDSRLAAAMPRQDAVDDGDSTARWSHVEYLLADLFDLLVAINAKDKQTLYPRPGKRRTSHRAAPERVAELRRRTGREVV